MHLYINFIIKNINKNHNITMSDFNFFHAFDKTNYFCPEEDIFSSYLNSEDTLKQNSAHFLFPEYKPNQNEIILNNFNNDNTKNIERTTMFTNIFKLPENSKLNDIDKSIFKSFNNNNLNNSMNINSNLNNNSQSFPSKLFDLLPNNSINEFKNDLIQNKRERADIIRQHSSQNLSKFKANSKSCSSLSEKDSGFLLFKTTKIKKNTEFSDDDKSDDDEITELDPICVKLQKNRMAAKKSRQKRKVYIQNLEDKVKYLEGELENQKKVNEKQNRMDDLIEMVSIYFD
jgi:hypothetical protein